MAVRRSRWLALGALAGALLVGLGFSRVGVAFERVAPLLIPTLTVIPAPPSILPTARGPFTANDQQLRSVQVSIADETPGKPIKLRRRTVELPPDAYVEGIIAGVTCPVGLVCPQTPLYNIVRGHSKLTVSAPTGEIVRERTVPGEEAAFEFIHAALR